MIIIATIFGQLKPLSYDEALTRFQKGINVVRKLEQVGQQSTHQKKAGLSVDEVFSASRRSSFSIEPSPLGVYMVSGGLSSPLLWFHIDGSLGSYGPFFELPDKPMQKLGSAQLRTYARQALSYVGSTRTSGWELDEIPSMYKSPADLARHPFVSYAITRKSSDIPWGPGSWGQISLLDFSGAVYAIRLAREFTAVEPFDEAMTVQEGEPYAARAVLALDNCDQVSLVKSGTKMVTGNAMLGGTYRTATPRVRKIAKESIGVLAYEYTFGNDDYSINGKYSVIHEVIIDAKSGDALRIQTPMPLGGSAPGKTPPHNLPTNKVKALIRHGSKKTSLGYVTLRQTTKPSHAKFTPAVLQLGQRYVDVEANGSRGVLVDGKYYKLNRVK